jgi:hypothetical protein
MHWNETNGRARRRMRAAVCAVGMACLAISTLGAQSTRRPQAHADSVRLVVDLYFRAVADERWDAAAAFVDTTAVRRLVAEQLRRPPRAMRREMTIEDFMQDDPNKPRVVAEYQLKQYQKSAARFDPGGMLAYEFAGIRSIDALRALTIPQATVAYIKATDFRVQMREQVRLSGCGDTTAATGSGPFSIRRIVATAVASDTAAYVLYEDGMFASMDPAYPGEPSVLILRWRGSAWKIHPSSLRSRSMSFGVSTVCDSTQRKPPR